MDAIHSKWRPKKALRKNSARAQQLAQAREKRLKKTTDVPARPAPNLQPRPTPAPLPPPVPGKSREKFQRFEMPSADLRPEEYIIIDSKVLPAIVAGLKCKVCNQEELSVDIGSRKGSAFKITVFCKACEDIHNQNSSSSRINEADSSRPPFEINRKLVEAFIQIGSGYSAMLKFATALDMKVMDQSTYRDHLVKLFVRNGTMKKTILTMSRAAVREAYEDRDASLIGKEIIDIFVSFDGSWHKRGRTSKLGVVAVIDVETGLVVDFEVLSKYCHMCTISAIELQEDSPEYQTWHKDHVDSGECRINFEGSSGNMESEGAVILWSRSVQEAKMRYTKFVSDGDAKSWSALIDAKPYGDDVQIEKDECINHVGKRMGTALRNVVSDNSKRGVTLGGKQEGALTVAKMDKLQGYYQKAFMQYAPDVEKMKKAILAPLHHYASTDKKPLHQFCPTGKDSWCFFQKQKALKPRSKPSHKGMKTTLNQKVFEAILPIYQRLSDRELLERCKTMLTQNANESLHNVLWSKVPKTIFVSKSRLELGLTQAVGEFNMGRGNLLQVEAQIDERPSSAQSMHNAEKIDRKRVAQSDLKSQVETKKKRSAAKKARKNKKQGKDLYNPGGGD